MLHSASLRTHCAMFHPSQTKHICTLMLVRVHQRLQFSLQFSPRNLHTADVMTQFIGLILHSVACSELIRLSKSQCVSPA